MNAYARSQMAYSQSKSATRTNQSIEYELFANITSALVRYRDSAKDNYSEFVTALHDNRRLWLVLASDVLEDGNMLPVMLRGQIVYLAEFTRLHTSHILNGDANVDPLIEINRSIMKGLFSQRGVK
ncbi:flagellar biosynthesis regulator FlaF [Dinoroseobacter sp. S76]|uniref:flagellar biosynthesis regulator FlaF n=1 Tax=Dinoroseobacter sp. S76 TaxID=3415124 RepID=UPI003C7CB00C